jgi:hypothetical protein
VDYFEFFIPTLGPYQITVIEGVIGSFTRSSDGSPYSLSLDSGAGLPYDQEHFDIVGREARFDVFSSDIFTPPDKHNSVLIFFEGRVKEFFVVPDTGSSLLLFTLACGVVVVLRSRRKIAV